MAEVLRFGKAKAVKLTRTPENQRLWDARADDTRLPGPDAQWKIISTHDLHGRPMKIAQSVIQTWKEDLWDGVDLIPEECIVR